MMARTILFLGAFLASSLALAQWELDADRSTVTFISTKNSAVAEQHYFSGLTGFVNPDGRAQVNIALDSLETLIPIRNERMREMLFETANFPMAQLAVAVDPAVLESLLAGGVVTTELPVTVKLHGVEQVVSAKVAIVGEGGGLRVIATQPVLVGAADFGLQAGVEALREVAGLNSISTAVPVSFNLVFNPAP